MCCMRLAENTGCKKNTKIRHLRTIAQFCQATFSQLRYVSTIEKKLLNSNISSARPHNMVNFGPLTAEIGCLEHPSKFQLVLHLAFVTAPMSLSGGQRNFAGCLAVSWAGSLYIRFWGLFVMEFCQVQNSLCI